jgi:hypothetical protein
LATVDTSRARNRPVASSETRPRVVVAALGSADELLGPLGDPFDRAAEPACGPQHQHPFGVKEILHAEAAADIGCRDLDAFERQVEHPFGELPADTVHPLPGQQQVQAVLGRVIAADRRPRLDRGRHEPVVDELDLGDMGRFGEGSLRRFPVAPLEPVGEIARGVVPDERRPRRQRRRSIRHGVEQAIVDDDQLDGVACQIECFGDDQCHGVADVAHSAAGQRVAWRHNDRVYRVDLGDAGERADPVGAQIGLGEYAEDARRSARRSGVDPIDRGMAMR